jgi:hypothetical protein
LTRKRLNRSVCVSRQFQCRLLVLFSFSVLTDWASMSPSRHGMPSTGPDISDCALIPTGCASYRATGRSLLTFPTICRS